LFSFSSGSIFYFCYGNDAIYLRKDCIMKKILFSALLCTILFAPHFIIMNLVIALVAIIIFKIAAVTHLKNTKILTPKYNRDTHYQPQHIAANNYIRWFYKQYSAYNVRMNNSYKELVHMKINHSFWHAKHTLNIL